MGVCRCDFGAIRAFKSRLSWAVADHWPNVLMKRMRSIPLRHCVWSVAMATGSAVLILTYLLSLDWAVASQRKAVQPGGLVPCAAFKKNPDGSWTATRNAALTIGPMHVRAGANTTYPLNAIGLDGIDFATHL